MKIILQNNFYIRDIFNFLKKENIAFLTKENISLQIVKLCEKNYTRIAVYSFEKYPLFITTGYLMIFACGKCGNIDLGLFIQEKYKIAKIYFRTYIFEGIIASNNYKAVDEMVKRDEIYTLHIPITLCIESYMNILKDN